MGNDAFSEDMATQGLKHLKGGKEEVRLTHSMLPPTLDIMASFSGGGVDGGASASSVSDGDGSVAESQDMESKAATATSAPHATLPSLAADTADGTGSAMTGASGSLSPPSPSVPNLNSSE